MRDCALAKKWRNVAIGRMVAYVHSHELITVTDRVDSGDSIVSHFNSPLRRAAAVGITFTSHPGIM
jgi:hypothetical protein